MEYLIEYLEFDNIIIYAFKLIYNNLCESKFYERTLPMMSVDIAPRYSSLLLTTFIYLSQFKDCVFPIVYECLTQQYSAVAFYIFNCVLQSIRD